MIRPTHRRLGFALACALASAPALAVPNYVFTNATSSDIPAIATFTTTGAMMDGLTVTAEFVGGGSQTLAWADTGVDSGGVAGTGWSLNQAGNTFSSAWTFSFTGTAALQLQRLILTGNTGLTVFDVDMYNDTGTCDTYTPTGSDQMCSDGSARGARMSFTDAQLAPTVTYGDIVGLNGASPVGDLFHVVTVDFGPNGIRSDFSFIQDTDNDIRFPVPLPGSIALLGLGLGILGVMRRRAR